MSRFVISEIAEAAGNVSANFAVQAASKAANFACGLYRDFPKETINNVPNIPFSFAKGFLDTLCSDRSTGLPPVPDSQFTGGQCRCARYGFNLWVQLDSGLIQERRYEVYGEISGFRLADQPNGSRHFEVNCRGFYFTNNCLETPIWQYLVGYPSFEGIRSWEIRELSRMDGDDNCGDPPPNYPDAPIPDSRKRSSVTINYNDGVDITVPVLYLAPSIDSLLKLDVGGVTFNFDFGGVSVDDVPDGTTDSLTDILQRLSEIDFILGDITGDINNVSKDTKKIQQDVDKPPPTPDSEDYDEDIKDESDDKEEDNIENLAYVKIELLTIPKNAKSQSGNDAPTVYYAGWFEFRTGDYAYPREYIHFQSSIFEAPSGSDGYAYTLYKGYTGRAIVIKQKEPV